MIKIDWSKSVFEKEIIAHPNRKENIALFYNNFAAECSLIPDAIEDI